MQRLKALTCWPSSGCRLLDMMYTFNQHTPINSTLPEKWPFTQILEYLSNYLTQTEVILLSTGAVQVLKALYWLWWLDPFEWRSVSRVSIYVHSRLWLFSLPQWAHLFWDMIRFLDILHFVTVLLYNFALLTRYSTWENTVLKTLFAY